MKDWQQLLADSIVSFDHLREELPGLAVDGVASTIARYPMRINPYYLALIKKYGDALQRQAVPDARELVDRVGMDDPLAEERLSPVPNLVHKYRDRVLFLISSQCALYCRFCTRKRKVGCHSMAITDMTIAEGLAYIKDHPEIKEVLLSGGDPLLLSDDRLDSILSRLRAIPSVEIIRIGTRVPCTLPMRVNDKLCAMLKKYHPLFINTHFNHPLELTPEASRACLMLADAGIPLGCQTVLLKGINDDPTTMASLLLGLLRLRVKPYYLFQADLTKGTEHFRTSTYTGLAIMKSLIGQISGMAIPTYALDAPDGKGKVFLSPTRLERSGNNLIFDSYNDEPCCYPEPEA